MKTRKTHPRMPAKMKALGDRFQLSNREPEHNESEPDTQQLALVSRE